MSDFYIDVKTLMFDADFINLIGRQMCKILDKKWGTLCSAVGGMELGSVPLSTAVAIKSNGDYNHFVVRKNIRGHGTKSQIEGLKYIENKNVVIIDDVLATGGSILKTATILEEHNVNCVGALLVVDRQEPYCCNSFPFPVVCLYTKRDILR